MCVVFTFLSTIAAETCAPYTRDLYVTLKPRNTLRVKKNHTWHGRKAGCQHRLARRPLSRLDRLTSSHGDELSVMGTVCADNIHVYKTGGEFIIMVSATRSFHNVLVVAQVATQDVLQKDHIFDVIPLQTRRNKSFRRHHSLFLAEEKHANGFNRWHGQCNISAALLAHLVFAPPPSPEPPRSPSPPSPPSAPWRRPPPRKSPSTTPPAHSPAFPPMFPAATI